MQELQLRMNDLMEKLAAANEILKVETEELKAKLSNMRKELRKKKK